MKNILLWVFGGILALGLLVTVILQDGRINAANERLSALEATVASTTSLLQTTNASTTESWYGTASIMDYLNKKEAQAQMEAQPR